MFDQPDQNTNQTTEPSGAPATPAPTADPSLNNRDAGSLEPVAEHHDAPADDKPNPPLLPADDQANEPTADTPDFSATSAEPQDDDDGTGQELLSLKRDAVEELTPLLDHLDQSPEEKFKTTMMLIQATDSANLIKVAHDAAKQISDEKTRAQALLDIVNEINYFTHGKGEDQDD